MAAASAGASSISVFEVDTLELAPLEPLAQFKGAVGAGEWSLRIVDAEADGVGGTLVDWELELELEACYAEAPPLGHGFRWEEVVSQSSVATSAPAAPLPRYGHSSIVVGRSMFVFGGIGGWTGQSSATLEQKHHSVRHDLWRFDAASLSWTELRPSRYTAPRRANLRSLITPWGLLRTGGVAPAPEGRTRSPLRALHSEFRSLASRLWQRLSSRADRALEARAAAPYAPGPEWHRSAEAAPNATGVGAIATGNAVPRARSSHSVVLLGAEGKESVGRGIATPRVVVFGACVSRCCASPRPCLRARRRASLFSARSPTPCARSDFLTHTLLPLWHAQVASTKHRTSATCGSST
jgi:hypothetical protein